MNSTEERKVRELFATKIGGPVYKLFYDGRMCKLKKGSERLLSKHQVIEKLGLKYDDMSYSDRAFVDKFWNGCIMRFQNRAWDMGQPWGTLRVRHKNGSNVWLHGYTMDPVKQEAMQRQKHWQSVGHYIAEKKQQRAFAVATGHDDDAQFELPMREEVTSFQYLGE